MDAGVEETCEVTSVLPTRFTQYYLGVYMGILFVFSLWAAYKLVDIRSIAAHTRDKFSMLAFKRRDSQNLSEVIKHESKEKTPLSGNNDIDTDIIVSNKNVDNNDTWENENMDSDNKNSGLKKEVQRFASKWYKSVNRYKSCYFVAANHIFDQVTDIAVAIEFMQLWEKERKYNNKISNDFDYCPGVNTAFLAFSSVFALLLYRIVSAISIFYLTKDFRRIFLQFFDLELFRTMKVNYINDSNNPCNPQRWLQSLESFLESTPQALIQLYFVIKSNIHGSGRSVSNTVYISSFWSIWMIANRAVSEDRLAFKEEYQDASINSWKPSRLARYCCIKKGYLARFFYRITDVFYRLCMLLLVWLFMGGFLLTVILFCESVAILYLCHRADELSHLLCVLSLTDHF